MTWILAILAFVGAYLWIQHGRRAWVDPAGAPFWISGSSYAELYAGRELPRPVRLLISIRRIFAVIEMALGTWAVLLGAYLCLNRIATWPPFTVCLLAAASTYTAIHVYVRRRRKVEHGS